MSRYLTRIAEILGLAESKRILDHKTFIKELQDAYLNEEYVEAINEQTSIDFKGSTSWNQIMLTIHHLVLTEAGKPVTKAARTNNTTMIMQSGCCELIKKTVNLAVVAPRMSLSCSDLMAIVFQILGKKTYFSYHNTYIEILVNILATKMYRLEVRTEQWQEIIRLCLSIYRHSSNVVKSDILESMRMAVQYGCLQSNLLPDVKKILPFLETVYQEIASGKEISMKPVYKLTYTVCLQIGTESRITLCEFSEKILPPVITHEGCPDKYNMLLLLIQIHHPDGASTNDDGAYARDWDQWRNIIRGIYASIVRDTKSEKLSPCLLRLACEMYRQVILDHSYITEGTPICSYSQDMQPRKRRRLSLVVRKPIDMLMNNDLQVTWPSIQILTVLLKKYPNTLKSGDYVTFLKTVTELVTASLNNEMTMDSLCELCTVLVNVEKIYFHETEQAESVRICWEKIWDTILRALSMNQNEILGHGLLQSIIEHRSALNPNAFLRLYVTNAIRWSSSSVKTLLTFCEYAPIPDELSSAGAASSSKPEASSTRISLLRWSLEISSFKRSSQIPVVELANLLTALVTRSWHKREFRDLRKFHDLAYQRKIESCVKLENALFDDREGKFFNDIERCNLALEFRKTRSDDVGETSKNIDAKVRIVLVNESLEFLISTLNGFLNERVTTDDLESVAIKLTIIAKLISNFAEFNIPVEPHVQKLANLFAESFKKICSLLVTMDSSKSSCSLVYAIEALEILYTTRYHSEVGQILIKSSSMSYLEYVYHLMLEDDEDEKSCTFEDAENSQGFNVHGKLVCRGMEISTNLSSELSDTCRVSNSSYKILAHFCCAPVDGKMSDAQKRVLKNLMKIDIYRSTSTADLRRALNILKTYGMSDQLGSSQESLEIATTFIQQLFDSRAKDETAVRGVLNVVPNFFQASTKLPRERGKLLDILLRINKSLTKKKYGPLVHVDLIGCLARVVQSDPLLTWRSSKFGEPSPIIETLVGYIKNPFYSVRLEVVRALEVVFSSKNLPVPCKVNFFRNIESAIPELFITEEIPNECEKADERLTRVTTAVYVYATILGASEYLRAQALYSMIELSVQRDIDIKTLKRALLFVERNEENQRRLIELNLHYLLSRWFESDYPLQLFPWILANCDSQEDFSRKYIATLLAIKLQRREFKHLAILCVNLEVSFEKTVENCFPTIMTILVSMIVEDSAETGNAEAAFYARQIYERLRYNTGEFESVKSFDDLLREKLSDIIVDFVKRLRDEEHFHGLFSRRVFLRALNPPNFNVATIQRCFDFLGKILPLASDKSLMEYLVTRCPSVLQQVLLTLLSNINEVNSEDHKLQAFHQYAYFGTMILRELEEPYFDPMSLYIVRDASYSLLALMREESLTEAACDYFYAFLSGSLPARSSDVKEILSFVVSNLVPFVQSSRVRGAMRILNLLIIEQRQLLAEAIEKLDSFPNEDEFEEIKRVHSSLKYGTARSYSLEDEIEHFLNATNAKTLSCSHEGLAHVRCQLSTRKQELRAMYGRLERLRGFAEDCASSTLHKFVYKLVQLTRSIDTAISLEAAKCLGELGPADLTTMILHPENVYVKEDIDQVAMLTFRVTSQLADYLVDNNMNLRRASSAALYTIFTTAWGRELSKKSLLTQLMITYRIDNPRLHDYIYPFCDRNGTAKLRVIHVDRGNWQRCVDPQTDLWIPARCDNYGKWIVDVTCKLLDCFANLYTTSLKAVCRESIEFCEILLPRLVNLVKSTDDHLVEDVCRCIDRFFSHVYESLRETDLSSMCPDSPVKRDVTLSYECVRCMINVVNFMRVQSSDNAPISLNYLYIAKAAQYCSAYFTSVLYAELWCESLLQDSGLLQEKVPGSWISAIDCICEERPGPGKLLQSIVREAYLHIGDPDSIYGCGLSHLIDSSYRTQHYVHLRQWDKVMLAQDVELSSGNSSTRGILQALRQSGLENLLGRVISTVNRDQENVDDFMYEAAWRLADWNILETRRYNENFDNSTQTIVPQAPNTTDYHSSHYRALKSLREQDHVGLKTFLDDARTSIVFSLRKTSLECSQTVYPILSQLRMLREIEDFAKIDRETNDQALDKWQDENSLDNHDFQWVEPILSQRLVMYRAQSNGNFTSRALIKTHFDIAEIAEKQGYLPIAARSLDSLARNNLSDGVRDQLTYQEAFLAWKRKDEDIGRYLMRNLIKKSNLSPSLRAKALRVYGNWMASTKSENPRAVIEKYYEESIKTSQRIDNKSSRDVKNLTNAQADLAQFADAQYQQIIEFMQSPQYESLVECTNLKNDETGNKPISSRGRDEHKAIITYQRQVTNDAAELENIMREKEMYLILAARYYLMTLQTGEEHDLLVFRLVSLWLDNTLNKQLNEILRQQLRSVPSYKFIVLLPQLAPHMSNDVTIFTSKINDLMERCAKEHPHHTLPVLLALKNTHKDKDFKQEDKGTQRRNDKVRAEPRVLAAETLIAKLADSQVKPIIREMNDLSHALVALAYFNVSEAQARKKDASHVIPRNQPITRIRDYTNTSVPTLTIDVRPSGNYNDVVGIREYVSTFDLPGGVNAPKKVICVGTDGLRRKQLVKGQDDLRQDAVMQQVCTVMNSMLRTSKETRKRKLHIRTYKIVPLSQRSGILEWCENTLPVSNVLCDTGRFPGMHTKYYPNDWSVGKCRLKLQAVDKSSMDVKLEAFLECCKNLHPAFHHFFMEKYPSAETWFERRLAYVRSVATTSMVGYMLGLGDRHFSNILIDQTTAEVIHIDFGIAFAQGKVLPIPETVPFRLTRDMEVAMGICGVEGVMRRSCEETVAVLRDRRKILITLLQVLLYDPLFSWAITPVKSDDRESSSSRRCSGKPGDDRGTRKTNKLAERALLRIEQKLQGTEDGIGSSISGQVERLIQQARDPANLCRLYSGWQAYL